MFCDYCFINSISNNLTIAKISFKKSFLDLLSFPCRRMLSKTFKELVFGPFCCLLDGFEFFLHDTAIFDANTLLSNSLVFRKISG